MDSDRSTHRHSAEAVAWSDDGGLVAISYTDSVSVLAAATGATLYDVPLPSEGFGPRMCILRVAVNNRGECAVLAGKYERLPGAGSIDDIVEPEILLFDEQGQLAGQHQFARRRSTWSERRGSNVRPGRQPKGLRPDVDLSIGDSALTVRVAADAYRLSLD
ncbi:hypothetical protein HN371_11315 [Candidatus Poribacteria bacterium]|nr:hypothetical protein [Candidatus Poribacteria bacterium]MBT5533044.1 hypothetical protein [Candidatus Poribacteria bacterium]MBT5710796.1 hypothetical protein [Candidatus Poribacteria bacterium]MBT7098538.1 hypothetical protein [Candidatus Poribacteria bacterium]MBT7808100.1 hypothetical protein [Candidatus Poribacteria bacterium]